MTKANAITPADFLGAKVLSPMEQDTVRGGRMACSQQQQQQQQQQIVIMRTVGVRNLRLS
ncbi:MAG: hypothetical protein AAFQ83_07245 [Bacteroidota bacterium]